MTSNHHATDSTVYRATTPFFISESPASKRSQSTVRPSYSLHKMKSSKEASEKTEFHLKRQRHIFETEPDEVVSSSGEIRKFDPVITNTKLNHDIRYELGGGDLSDYIDYSNNSRNITSVIPSSKSFKTDGTRSKQITKMSERKYLTPALIRSPKDHSESQISLPKLPGIKKVYAPVDLPSVEVYRVQSPK